MCLHSAASPSNVRIDFSKSAALITFSQGSSTAPDCLPNEEQIFRWLTQGFSQCDHPTFISCEEGVARYHNTCILSWHADFPLTGVFFNCWYFANFCVKIAPNLRRACSFFLINLISTPISPLAKRVIWGKLLSLT